MEFSQYNSSDHKEFICYSYGCYRCFHRTYANCNFRILQWILTQRLVLKGSPSISQLADLALAVWKQSLKDVRVCTPRSLTIIGFILHDIFLYPDFEASVFSNWSAMGFHGSEIHLQTLSSCFCRDSRVRNIFNIICNGGTGYLQENVRLNCAQEKKKSIFLTNSDSEYIKIVQIKHIYNQTINKMVQNCFHKSYFAILTWKIPGMRHKYV